MKVVVLVSGQSGHLVFDADFPGMENLIKFIRIQSRVSLGRRRKALWILSPGKLI